MSCRWLLMLVVALAPAIGAAQERDDSGADDPGRRWSELSPEQRELVRERFARWRELPAEERSALQGRHHVLQRMRRDLLEQLPEHERRRLRELPPRERKRALQPLLAERLAAARRELEERAGGAAPPTRPPRGRMRKSLREHAAHKLLRLEEDGRLPPGEAERLLDLPPWEMAGALLALKKRRVEEDPPRVFLALPPEERAQLLALPPAEFVGELRRLRGGRADRPPLSPTFADVLRGRVPKPREVPDAVLRPLLTEQEAESLAGLAPAERPARVAALLREKARQALLARRDRLDLLELADEAPPGIRERRYLRLIDPSFEPRRLRHRDQGAPPDRPPR